jgi:SET domain-containing protein
MTWMGKLAGVLLGALVVLASVASANGPPARGPILRADPKLDERTVIAPSAIPGSGYGLFARVAIKKGEVIGELGGQLLEELDIVNPSAYVAGLPDCAVERIKPYRYIDSKDHGGNVSRVNFAPRAINGKDTGFQNAKIQRVCWSPWVLFVAIQDIEPGQEIWSSYGPDYNYERFMQEEKVRDFFCGLINMDCREKYEYDH